MHIDNYFLKAVCIVDFQVKRFTLYDVVLDWVLMDAFDDLCNPPSSVLSVVQNRWLSTGLKETAIATAVWSILKAKRRLLKVCLYTYFHVDSITDSGHLW